MVVVSKLDHLCRSSPKRWSWGGRTSEIPFLLWRRQRTVHAILRGFLRWRKRDSDLPFWKRKILLSERTKILPCKRVYVSTNADQSGCAPCPVPILKLCAQASSMAQALSKQSFSFDHTDSMHSPILHMFPTVRSIPEPDPRLLLPSSSFIRLAIGTLRRIRKNGKNCGQPHTLPG